MTTVGPAAARGARASWFDRRLLLLWVAVAALAFIVIPIAGAALESVAAHGTKSLVQGHKPLAVVVIAVIGGVFEGVLLGRWQWRLLVRRMPDLQRRHWVLATLAPVLAVWLLVVAPKAVDIMARGGETLATFRNGFIQALVLGPLIGLSQARALRLHSRRWAWWLLASVTTYLSGVLMLRLGLRLADRLSVSSKVAFSFPILAAAIHGTWMLWVTAPQATGHAGRGGGVAPSADLEERH